MTRATRRPIPVKLHGDDREVLGFLQNIMDYQDVLVPVGGSIKYGSATLPPNGHFLTKSGQTVNKSDYPDLWSYAQGDVAYTTTATTVTLPLDAGFIVRAR